MEQNARGEARCCRKGKAEGLLGTDASIFRKGRIKAHAGVALLHRIDIVACAVGDGTAVGRELMQGAKPLAKAYRQAAPIGKVACIGGILADPCT